MGGGAVAKILYREFFRPPPHLKKFRAPILPWKLRVNPTEKHVNSIFTRIFFQGPLTRVKIFKAPFLHEPPNKCLWTVPNKGKKCKSFVRKFLRESFLFCLGTTLVHKREWKVACALEVLTLSTISNAQIGEIRQVFTAHVRSFWTLNDHVEFITTSNWASI